jgi:hypothetical protein
MDGGESFVCEAFDGFYYGTNGLFYILYPLRFNLTICDTGLVGYDGYMELFISPPKVIAARSNISQYKLVPIRPASAREDRKTERHRMWRKQDLDTAVPIPASSPESNHLYYLYIVRD